MLWTERKFDFEKQIADFPDLIEKLAETPELIVDIVADCDLPLLEKKSGGKWSIKEHIGHLHDLEELHSGRLTDFKAGKEILRPADMKNRKTEEANHNLQEATVLIDHFRKSRNAFLDQLEDFDRDELLQSALHERLGKQMRVIDMLEFMVEHDAHHLLAMKEIIRSS